MTVANDNAELPAVPDKQLLFDLPRESYDSLKSELNWSTAKELGRSAAHFKYALEHKYESTDLQARGIAGHVATLEPRKYGGKVYDALDVSTAADGTLYSVWPKENGKRGTKAWDGAESLCNLRGQRLILQKDHEWCVAIAAAVHAKVAARPLLVGRREVTLRWKQTASAMAGGSSFTWRLKGRVDQLVYQGQQLVGVADLKSTRDASIDGFMKQVAMYGYHAQAAFYVDGVRECTGLLVPYYWIAVESEPPHCVTVIEASDQVLALGRDIYCEHLELFRRCTERNEWPQYAEGIVRGAELPRWAMPFEDEEGDAGGSTPHIGF